MPRYFVLIKPLPPPPYPCPASQPPTSTAWDRVRGGCAGGDRLWSSRCGHYLTKKISDCGWVSVYQKLTKWFFTFPFTYPLAPGSLGQSRGLHNQFPSFFVCSPQLSETWRISRPVHVVVFPPILPLLFTVPCKLVLVRPYERKTCSCHFSLHLITMVRSSCGPIAYCILARTVSLVTWS